MFQGQQRGIDFAVEDIADGGGVLGGPLDATTTPAPLDGTEADIVPTAVDEGAQALIGPTGSSGALEYRDAVQNADSISCSPSASVPGLTAEQETFGLFRTALPDDVTVGYLTDMVIDRRDAQAPGAAWKVAIVARNDDYGLAIGNGLAYALDSHGLVPTVVDYNAHRVQFTGTATEVTALQPDLTVIVAYEEGAPIVTELVRGGVDPAAMIGLESFFRPRIATLAAPDGNAELVDGLTMVGTTGDLPSSSACTRPTRTARSPMPRRPTTARWCSPWPTRRLPTDRPTASAPRSSTSPPTAPPAPPTRTA